MNITCQQCGAEIAVQAHLATAACPYCGSASIIERPEAEAPSPRFAIGFAIDRAQAIQRLRAWIQASGSTSAADLGFDEKTAGQQLQGIYLPAFLFSARAETAYSAEIAEEYEVIETYTDAEGNRQKRRRTEIEWRPLAGKRSEYLTDVLVTASRGLDNQALERIEPFDLTQLRRFDPRLLAGWPAEIPSRSPEEVERLARHEAIWDIASRLGHFMPGVNYRNLQRQTVLEDVTLDHLLVPVWSLRLQGSDGRGPIRLLVNGQTGRCGGKLPASSGGCLGCLGPAVLIFALILAIASFLAWMNSA